MCFYGFQKTNGRFRVLAGWAVGRIEGQSIPDVARLVGVHHSTIMETIPNKPNSHTRTWSRSSKSYDPRKYRYTGITVVAKRHRK
ncbi:hypothetical protein TNCV_2289611 [Trichonephila clavipes]|uniref:Transposase IS30-like HTH domain-containing protein n=1 Tax=Trichonephila clavipes TaxID=2585209 RepID=A0A8X6RIT1_TRICX|nr:hypothetical protein TNCV_2289611 [Trichonephila clavipes]